MAADTTAEPPPSEHPFDRVLRILRQLGRSVRPRGPDGARAQCPNHPDANPSLAITRKESTVLLHCFAGCRQDQVVAALGLRMAHLFVEGAPREHKRIVAEYDYYDLHGTHIAQKVRYEPKTFRWRHVDPRGRGGYRWGFNGTVPSLYRLPDLMERDRVYCVEGEKDVEYLRGLGLVATCPPAGASSWQRAWSIDLLTVGCRELIILPDADVRGREHAERVAADVHAASDGGLAVKVVALPGLSGRADAFDWFRDGGTFDDFAACVSAASYWAPGAAEREREERQRRLTRERVRRHRARKRLSPTV